MSQKEPAIWQRRWDALEQSIVELQGFLKNNEEVWAQSTCHVLECLKVFGKSQFDFFQDGFRDGSLVHSSRYNAEYAIRQTIDQIAYDLSVLRQAALQRYVGSSLPTVTKTLEIADRLAYRALKPAIDARLLNDTTVFSYLQKAPYVRVVPYAPIAMIGIPETCTGIFARNDNDEVTMIKAEATGNGSIPKHTARDFLAIAHEAGHYVFWHGKKRMPINKEQNQAQEQERTITLRSYLRSKMSNTPIWRYSWLEEIFADVYGALIAGPVLALDFQEVLFDNANLALDDGEHPAPVIRPYIYSQTLKHLKLDNRFTKAPNLLEERWHASKEERDQDGSFTPKGSSEPVRQHKAEEELNNAIILILEALEGMLPQNQDDLWSKDTELPDQSMYDEFLTKVLNDNTINMPNFEAMPSSEARGNESDKERSSQPDNTVLWEIGRSQAKWLDLFREAKGKELTLLPEIWHTLLDGGGWAAGGPDNDASPKTG